MSNNYLDNSVYLRLEVSIWTGKARLSRDDIPNADELPPDTLATLGTKRIFDPAKLRPFGALKTRAVRACDQHGVRCMGGWIVETGAAQRLAAELQVIRDEFDRTKSQFVSDYDAGADAWLAQYPEWASILRPALPESYELHKRFAFRWQVLEVKPVESPEYGGTAAADIGGLEDTALEAVAGEVKELLGRGFTNERTSITIKSLRPLNALADKCDNYAFTRPEMSTLADVFRELAKCEPTPGTLSLVRTTLTALSTPAGLRSVTFGATAQSITKGMTDPAMMGLGSFMPDPEEEAAPEPLGTAVPPSGIVVDPEPAMLQQVPVPSEPEEPKQDAVEGSLNDIISMLM